MIHMLTRGASLAVVHTMLTRNHSAPSNFQVVDAVLHYIVIYCTLMTALHLLHVPKDCYVLQSSFGLVWN